MHFDERATAFMALGFGRATGRPAAWITTSGTALANGYPAIVEASMEAVPMLLLTADRPPELRDTDANQTIRQDRMFGEHVRWFVDIPTPTEDIPVKWLLSTVDEAAFRARTGPVHLNCMFRKPLVPDPSATPTRDEWWSREKRRMAADGWKRWTETNEPFTAHLATTESHTTQSAIVSQLQQASRPLVVFGRLRGEPKRIQDAASRLVRGHEAVGVVDIGSQARLGMSGTPLIPAIDAILYGDPTSDQNRNGTQGLTPDLILQFGASPVSRRLQEWAPDAMRVVVDDRPRRVDPMSRGGSRIDADPIATLLALADDVDRVAPPMNEWQQAWEAIRETVTQWHDTDLGTALTEQVVAHSMTRFLPEASSLTVASSNPVRHADLFAATSGHARPVSVNRGASGIDGTLATACGFGDGSESRSWVLIGDLALLHDLTSLTLCAERDAVVVVINNDGGGIFSYLPIREHEAVFEPWFGTPHGQDFRAAAQQFGLAYEAVESVSGLESVLKGAQARAKSILIEVRTDRDENLQEQRRLLRALRDRIAANR